MGGASRTHGKDDSMRYSGQDSTGRRAILMLVALVAIIVIVAIILFLFVI